MDLPCGDNMSCTPDTLGIKKIKFCRCIKGFKAQDNNENIPAFCISDPESPEPLNEYENYEHGSGAEDVRHWRICSTLLILILLLNAT